MNEWVTKKPEFEKECLVISAVKRGDNWEYETWVIKPVDNGEGCYLAWLTGDLDEYGDLADFQADKYFVMDLLK